MDVLQRIDAFSQLGAIIKACVENNVDCAQSVYREFDQAVTQSKIFNPWFISENVKFMLLETARFLEPDNLNCWLSPYYDRIVQHQNIQKIGVVMAGNIPAVGFHDFLCVLMSGNSIIAKLSSNDRFLIPFFSKILIEIEPRFAERIRFTDSIIKDYDAIIATGSNNSARYFEKYFEGYPHIIRKNRNSVAVLDSSETEKDLHLLCKDIFLYFGLGCRNVTKLFVPTGYLFDKLFKASMAFQEIISHHKYASNYTYNRAINLMSGIKFYDNGLLLIKNDPEYASPVSVIHYCEYVDIKDVNEILFRDKEKIQCIVARNPEVSDAILFGTTQHPQISDYADGIDTMEFLLSL